MASAKLSSTMFDHSPSQTENLMNHLAPRRPTLLVMHPDPLLRAGLEAALRQHPAFETVVDGVNGAVSEQPRVDVVITDYENAMRSVASTRPTHDPCAVARILVLTANDREADIRRAVEEGIHGYIILGGPLQELIEGVMTVASGVRYMSRCVAQRMADSLIHTSLTSREINVLSLIAAGESNKAIARDLRIEVATVKSHMTAIVAKLGVSSRTQAAGIAAIRGLVEQRAPLGHMPQRASALDARAQLV